MTQAEKSAVPLPLLSESGERLACATAANDATPQTEFHCPGERVTISRSVHLARLAAGYIACRDCPSRNETGLLPKHVVRRSQSVATRKPGSLIHHDGIRGVTPNDLTPERLARIVEHVLDLADEARHRPDVPRRTATSTHLRVTLGHDFRDSSPELSLSVMAALKRNGCDVADLGHVTRPEHDFAMNSLQADLGLLITGGTSPPPWNGLDILSSDGQTWTRADLLGSLEERLERTPARLGRQRGNHYPTSVSADYEAVLTDLFHAIRPLRIAVACPDPLIRRRIQVLLEPTGCRVSGVGLGTSIDAPVGHAELTPRTLSSAIIEKHADLGFLIPFDGRSCTLFDEHGEPFTPQATLALLQQTQHSPREDVDSSFRTRRLRRHQPTSRPRADQSRTDVSLDGQQRIHFAKHLPDCDALLTIARVLETLSESDRALSTYRSV